MCNRERDYRYKCLLQLQTENNKLTCCFILWLIFQVVAIRVEQMVHSWSFFFVHYSCSKIVPIEASVKLSIGGVMGWGFGGAADEKGRGHSTPPSCPSCSSPDPRKWGTFSLSPPMWSPHWRGHGWCWAARSPMAEKKYRVNKSAYFFFLHNIDSNELATI